MSQTLVIRTPDAVSTATRAFPKQGMFNLKISKNGEFDTVELWFRSATGNITLELEGASFQSTAQDTSPRVIPETPTVISGSTLELTPNSTQYMKIKLNKGISIAYLRCSYAAKSKGSTVAGGNISGQAFVDYGRKPYISTSLKRMFQRHPVRTNLTEWDVSDVTDMDQMFRDATSFNQDLSSWDVSKVTTMDAMFYGAASFNKPIGNWDTSNVTIMRYMFRDATSFNQDLSSWDVSKVTDMIYMFYGAASFNKPIGNWDVSKVTDMTSMFHRAASFDQDLSNWNVSNVTSMRSMFHIAASFNKPIGNWDVSKVTDMRSMFDRSPSFDQHIGDWDISSVTDMTYMFSSATSFDQDLSNWPAKFNIDVILSGFFLDVRWSTTNYDKFLIALWTDTNTTRPQDWASRTAPKVLQMGLSNYSAASAAARASLVSNGWTITDGGLAA